MEMKTIRICALFVCGAMTAVAAPVQTVLHAPRVDEGALKSPHVGIPSIAVSPKNGRVWITWYGGPLGGENHTNYCLLMTSGDGGVSWQEVLVADPDGPDGPWRAFDPELWIGPDGVLRWTWTERNVGIGGKWGRGLSVEGEEDRLMMCELNAEEMPAAPYPVPRRIGRGVMMCKPIVLRDGAWLFPVARWQEERSSFFYASTDGGKTFVERGGITLPKKERRFDEHQAVEMKDGSILAVSRIDWGFGYFRKSRSTDGGRTWSEPEKTSFAQPSSRVFLTKLRSGAWMLVKNGLFDEGAEREQIVAYYSTDEGRTWGGGLVLDRRANVSYPDGVELADGRILVVYDRNRLTDRELLVSSFTEEELKRGGIAAPSQVVVRGADGRIDGSIACPVIPKPKSFKSTGGVRWLSADEAKAPVATVTRDAKLPQEGYRLSVRSSGIRIAAATDEGEFRARTTLGQLVRRSLGRPCVPCCEIEDAPTYRWRGYMLDESRHFFGVEEVKRILDLMAEYKLNVFHWHFVDDQGWRVEIKKYPKLLEYGAKRPHSPPYGANDGDNRTPYGPFWYTQEQIRELVAYAAARHVTVVPEIEIPGHSRAVLAAYPEFACDAKSVAERVPRCVWGISDEVTCAGNPAAMKFFEDVLDELLPLFPGDVVHLGGDECPRKHWKTCPRCQARMKREGLKTESELQASVTRHFCAYLERKGKRMMAWDETLVGGYGEAANADFPKSAIAQSWRGTDPAVVAATNGFDAVVSPWQTLYLSVPQGCENDPYAYSLWLGPYSSSLRRVYNWDPCKGVPESARAHILGSEACLWTERINDASELAYKSWPRAFAMAETLWTAEEKRDFWEFKRRAAHHRRVLMSPKWRINCAPLE